MFKIPELLAPAGGMEQLKAAVENGAEVYSRLRPSSVNPGDRLQCGRCKNGKRFGLSAGHQKTICMGNPELGREVWLPFN